MSRRTPPTYAEIVRALGRAGFELVRTRGSHARFRRGGRSVTVKVNHPSGRPGPGTYARICGQCGFEPGGGR